MRPYAPGYGIRNQPDGMLPWSWAQARLAESHNYWIVTTRPDGNPHAMPVWGVLVDSVFYFSTGQQSRKARNLAGNPNCVVCNENADRAVVLEGRAEVVQDAALVEKIALPYYRKYKPWKLDPELGHIYAVRPRVVFGFEEKTFVDAATKWVFDAP